MKSTDWTYLARLARAMQQECIDGRVAGDFIAEIDAHLAESGLDPVAEFGSPAQLARQVAGRDNVTRRWRISSPWWAIGVGLFVLVLLVAVVEGIQSGWSEQIALPAAPLGYGLTIAGLSMAFGVIATRRLDGRTWAPLVGWKSIGVVGAIAVLGTSLSAALADRILVTVPSTLVVGAAIVGIPAVIAAVVLAYNPIRFPAHAPHLRPLRRGLWADAFGGRPRPRPSEPAGN
jgi:hypothetical protein